MQELLNNLIGRSEVLIYALVLTGIVISLAIRWGILFVKKPNGKNGKTDLIKKIGECVLKIENQTSELLKMHDVRDQDGTPIWYVPRSLESSINRLADSIDALRMDLSKKK